MVVFYSLKYKRSQLFSTISVLEFSAFFLLQRPFFKYKYVETNIYFFSYLCMYVFVCPKIVNCIILWFKILRSTIVFNTNIIKTFFLSIKSAYLISEGSCDGVMIQKCHS